ncbi:echinoderm microtubule-associated protein-like 1 isoform X1 [Falco biarmicus]|uniref:echinoderm microtubule-associated protein-like 1 isoform X1 n=2 Tax=Falco TaxID=8952 RepID=UPI000FFC70F0|nr:echinoderm microtubule-associated protein-like 1 isoform X1 [Falco peregrinus]XP_027660802.1 echinoderm microtubule-associated protein-like 1 isoform X1 [Falco cherrug]XP_037249424.1 echinoderm microtubule-associated protein-like 1 isoform X2 [Falco rusticolus]XP_040455719.1 echinoderm microtubule-associated protein-like 1 isoform X2 [Falco naumanni]XP_056203015.1 echinoderm microtubule-associated protein-like 1 isoform X1 [Falco biarmicus]
MQSPLSPGHNPPAGLGASLRNMKSIPEEPAQADHSGAPEFCADDSASAASSMEVTDRIASLEQRVQMQEDDIQLLKSALADVVRRLNITEEQQAMQNKKGPTKARPLVQTLPLRTTVNNGTVLPKKPSGSLPSPSGTRKETVSPAAKRSVNLLNACKLKKPALSQVLESSYTHTNLSTIKRTSSAERVSPGSRRESYGDSKGSRNRTGSTSSSSSGKKNSESKPKEPMFSAGKRRVTHCKEEGYVKMFLRGRPVTMYMPKEQVESYNLEAKVELPAKRLKLEWVYGYRGRDCRSNLYLLPTGETVYFIASVVVLFNVEEQLQRHYTGHNDDVKCLAVHPDRITIATGQVAGTSKDGKQLPPHVRVWDSVTLNTLHVIGMGFFDRAVTCIAFSKSNGGSSLCSVDDSNDHVLSVWDWQKEEKLADVKCSNEAVFAADFHPTDTNIIVTCGKSHLYFWTLEGNSLIKKQGLFEKQEKPKFVLCVTFSENGDTITGDSSGNILVWGKGTNRISHAVQGAHEGGIFALCMLRDGTLVSGGGKDRKLISWNGNYQKLHKTEIPEQFGPIRTVAEGKGDVVLIGTTRNFVLQGTLSGDFFPITQGHTDELWGLAVHSSKPQFFTCGHDKHITLWDATTHHPIWNKTIEDPAQSSGFHPSASVVAVGTLTGRWFVFDTETKDLVTVHTDGNEQLSVMRYSPDGNFLAIGSHDNCIYIYGVSENGRKYTRIGKCSGHSSFITHLDWSVNSQYLVSNSGDYEILYWIPSACKQVVSVETTRDIEWATYTCTLGFHVFGVWPEGSDGTDINAVCRSHGRKLLSTGDDFGKVHLFSYPCSQFRAPSHVYGGHSSHVTNVDFLCEDTHLISTGGKDTSIMQWRVI